MRKIFFTLLIASSFALTAYFTFRALQESVQYFSLKEQAKAQILKWEIREVDGKFPITAHYQFEHQGKTWTGFTCLAPPWHLNEPSAIQELKQNKMNKSWMVWFCPKDPKRSSLEKIFPTNWAVRAIICWGIVIYFLVFTKRMLKIIFN